MDSQELEDRGCEYALNRAGRGRNRVRGGHGGSPAWLHDFVNDNGHLTGIRQPETFCAAPERWRTMLYRAT
jgi:hypothetical protein